MKNVFRRPFYCLASRQRRLMILVGSMLRMKMYYRARGTKQSWSCRCLPYGSSETENVGFLKSLIYSGLTKIRTRRRSRRQYR
ncbi:hypothetical protein NEISICOT_01656 [Neisseria sicca ATCC 29256]|uniref:Uncharacterized protein n=1 Tax=Neisseria sicca ATCC 29256 TaxID=547045 RepID=C6M557_NEISI|nr:hypothetical protein NEISICOT_01656 [Neisseria sicca ATCC 29256]